MDHAIKFNGKMFLNFGEQLLIYIRGEKRVRKSRIVKAIEMDFTLLSKKKELVISVSIGSAANSISGSTMHIVLRVNN